MNMDRLWHWLLWPVQFVDAKVLSGDLEIYGASWTHTLVLAIASFLSLGTALLLAALFGYIILPMVDRTVEGLLRWSCLGTSMATVRRTAHRYAGVSTLLRNLRYRLPITAGSSAPNVPSQLPVGRSIATRIGQSTIRLLASMPYFARGAAAEAIHLIRSPLFLYCLAASTVNVMAPQLDSARALISSAWHWAGKPDSIAGIGLLAAFAAVLLDHGLSSRIRARNAWRRSRGERAEEGLANLSVAAQDLAVAVDECVEDLTRLAPFILQDAAVSGAKDLVTAWDGKVERNPIHTERGRSRDPRRREDWSSDSPLLHYSDPWGLEEWEPDAKVSSALAALTSIVDQHGNAPFGAQAPRATRYFVFLTKYHLLGMNLDRLRRDAWESIGKRLHREIAMVVKAAEYAVRQCDEDHATHKGGLHGPAVPPGFASRKRTSGHLDLVRCQQELDTATKRCHKALWDAEVVAADAEGFATRIRDWQRPRGPVARVVGRFGG